MQTKDLQIKQEETSSQMLEITDNPGWRPTHPLCMSLMSKIKLLSCLHPILPPNPAIKTQQKAPEHDAARGLGYAEGEDGDALPEGGGEQLHVRAHRGQVAAPRDAHVQPHLGVARVVHAASTVSDSSEHTHGLDQSVESFWDKRG